MDCRPSTPTPPTTSCTRTDLQQVSPPPTCTCVVVAAAALGARQAQLQAALMCPCCAGVRAGCATTQAFREALKDATKCIELAPEWAKVCAWARAPARRNAAVVFTHVCHLCAVCQGYFRRGVALKSLFRYGEAKQAFQQALDLDPTDAATKRALTVRLRPLQPWVCVQKSPPYAVALFPGIGQVQGCRLHARDGRR